MSKQTEGKPITSDQVQLLSDRCWPYLHLVNAHSYYGVAISVGPSHEDPKDAVVYDKDEQRAVAWLITDYVAAKKWSRVGIINGTNTLKSALWLRLCYNKIKCIEYEPTESDEHRYSLMTVKYPEITKSLKIRTGALHERALYQAELSKLPENKLS